MAESLQDQFLKAGLISRKQANHARHESRKARKGPNGKQAEKQAEAQRAEALEAERRTKAEHDRALNRERLEAQQARAAAAQVRQLIEGHRIDGTAGDVPFNVQDGATVRTLTVTEPLRERLLAGTAAVVGIEGLLAIVAADVASRIEARDASAVKYRRGTADGADAGDAPPDPDDPYAAYVVPDDLVW